ncbi:iron chelate uptake ABC transporter family permease subunit [Actinomadura kijaniata]|uniref:Iron complex transport system permease protein n=1 Tax=Actinomadura namibiensis TaxID=182080 RepID=A0A7W3QQL0_ACTNM|nr:iron ABC transporter permease [Actinomadura namibiensis]MBA8955737.1 iron complex transport system permease protein [Actinomadura namibiensis]
MPQRRRTGGRVRWLAVPAGSAGPLALAVLASLAVGSRGIAPDRVLAALLDPGAVAPGAGGDVEIVRSMRVPRTVTGLAVGAGLAVAGVLMQALTRNPLADPRIMGVTSGASLGVVAAITLFGLTTPPAYVWFGVVGVLTVNAQTFDQYRFWAVGSLAGRPPEVALWVLPFVAAGLVIAFGVARGLDALAPGDDMARGLGRDVGRTRLLAAVAAVLLTGAAVAAAGPIGFVGLAVPHLARALTGTLEAELPAGRRGPGQEGRGRGEAQGLRGAGPTRSPGSS